MTGAARFLVGGYSAAMGGTATGIGLAEVDAEGGLRDLGIVAAADSPSWLHVDGGRLFAALEGEGRVASWELGLSGRELVPTGTADAGGFPCHLELDGDRLLVANYGGGTLGQTAVGADGSVADAVIAIAGEGRGPHPAQDASHIHSSVRLPDGRVLVADLGTDAVSALAWDGSRYVVGDVLHPTPGTGPRDLLVVGPDRVLVLGELSCEVLLLDTSGTEAAVLAVLPLPGARAGDHAAGLAFDARTGLLHVGLRGSDVVSVLRVERDALVARGSVPCGGRWPRHLVVHDGLLHVANQLSGTVASFRLEADALPRPLGPARPVPSPTHLVPLPDRGWEHLEPLLG